MSPKRHSAVEVRAKLREADVRVGAGVSVAEICDELGVSKATYHRWRNQFQQTSSSMLTEPLQKENESLRRTVIDLLLQIDTLRNGANGRH